jgi:hypothetical protein
MENVINTDFRKKNTCDSNMLNKYARVKNVAIVEDIIKDNIDQTYDIVDELLDEEIKRSRMNELDEDLDYEYWSSNHNAPATLSITNLLQNKCMNLFFLPEK